MFNLISGFTMGECSELITCAYNSAAWYRYLAQDSEQNRDYWLERAEKSELLADKLNDAYSKALYVA
jgi:hypothetical protein